MGARVGPRRSGVRGVCAAATMAVTLVAGAVVPSPASAQDEVPDGLLPPGDWASWQVDYMLDLIDQAEADLSAYSDPDALSELGYINIGVTAPGGWDHYVNVGMMLDEHVLDPAYPESLVFRRGADGSYTLVAAMLFLDLGSTIDDVPAELLWLPGWHVHPELCTNAQGMIVGFTTPGTNNCPPGSFPAVGPPMMHVWVEDNACGHRFGGVGVGGLHCDDYGTPLPEEGYPYGMEVEAEVDGSVAVDTVFGEPLSFPTGSEGVCNPEGTATMIMGSFSADDGNGHATFTDAHAMGQPADLVVDDDGAICGTINLELGDGELTASGDSGSFTISGVTGELDIDGTGAYEQHIPDACALSLDIGELSGTMTGDGAPNTASLSASGVSVAGAPESCGYYGAMLDFALSLPSSSAEVDLDLSVNWAAGGGDHEHDM